MTKHLFILFSFVLFSTSVFANKIDSLQSDSDVYKFLVSLDSNIKWVHIDYSYMFGGHTDEDRRIADSIHVKMWQKTDFNNDGQTDLLVYGYLGEACLFAVIYNNGKYSIHFITVGSLSYPVFPVIKKDNQVNSIILYYREESIDSADKKFGWANKHFTGKILCKTLIYKFNYFVEPNYNPTRHFIQNIAFSTEQCFGTCPVYKLFINSKREAVYESEIYSGTPGKYHTIIDTASYNRIVALLDYINYPSLSERYSVDWTDMPTCYLTISYDHGKKKKIKDYGEQGTYGLEKLYDEFFKLRKTQNWRMQK